MTKFNLKSFEKNVRALVGGKSDTAFDRLKELQAQGIDLAAITLEEWCNLQGAKKLIHNNTKFFPDGWDRYTGNIRCAKETRETIPTLYELYLASHRLVYQYDLMVNK